MAEEYRKKFAENLVQLMALYNMSRDVLSKELGLTEMAVFQYETAKRFPNIDILCRLADMFHVTLDQLVGRKPKDSIVTWYKKEDFDKAMEIQKSIRAEKAEIQKMLVEFDQKYDRIKKLFHATIERQIDQRLQKDNPQRDPNQKNPC